MPKQPFDSLVSMVATIEAHDLELEEIEHGAVLPTSADGSDRDVRTDVEGGKIEAAALVRVGLGGAPSSHPHTPEPPVSHGLAHMVYPASSGHCQACGSLEPRSFQRAEQRSEGHGLKLGGERLKCLCCGTSNK
jgi:hypothetical protein